MDKPKRQRIVEGAPQGVPGALDAWHGATEVVLQMAESRLGESIEVLVENEKRSVRVLGEAKGVAAMVNVVNANRRYYSDTVYKLAVERAGSLMSKGRFVGEVDHPMWASLQKTAFRFTDLSVEDGLVTFEGVVLDTSAGRELKGLLDGGVGVGVSTRGYGSITYEDQEVGGETVQVGIIGEDYAMEGIDFVLFPSNPAGEVKTHEGTTSHQEASVMTIEELRQEHPDLVAQVEAEAREGLHTSEELESAVAKAAEDARTEALESEDVTIAKAALSAVVEGLRPFVPELQQVDEDTKNSEAEERAEELAQTVESLTSKVETLTSELESEREEKQKAEARAAVEAAVEESLAENAFADLLRDELLKLESAEAVKQVCEERTALLVAATAKEGEEEPAGTGDSHLEDEEDRTDEGGSDNQAGEWNEQQQKDRALAGLPLE